MVTSTTQIFSSASCVQLCIIPERLNQIYIAVHRCKEDILIIQANLSLVSNFKGRATCERKSALGILYLRLVLTNQRYYGTSVTTSARLTA